MRHHLLHASMRDDKGSIAVFAALALPVIIGCAAIAVDIGSIYLERRTAQGIVDLAAMNAAAHPDIAETAARSTLAANGIRDVKSLIVTKGNYAPDAKLPVAQRFRPGQEPLNAVRVEFTRDTSMFFAAVFRSAAPEYQVVATASFANRAMFSVGTRLAAIRDGVPNQILSALTGTRISLSAMDYNALLNANVRVDDALNALAAELDITGASFDSVLASRVSLTTFAKALAAAAINSEDRAATSALSLLSRDLASSLATIEPRRMLDLGQLGHLSSGQPSEGLSARLNALDMMRTAAMLANGSRQVEIDLALNIPGVTRSRLTLAIGEPLQYSALASVGDPGSHVHTAQLKLKLVTEIGGQGPLAGMTLRLPIYAEMAHADASLAEVACDGPSKSASVEVRPGLARIAIADVSDAYLASPVRRAPLPLARILSTPILDIKGRAEIEAASMTPTTLTFTEDDVTAGRVKRAETQDVLASIATSLLGRLTLEVDVIGLNLAVPGLKGAVIEQLRFVARPIDSALEATLATLGVHLGEADVRVHAIRCDSANLVD